MWSPLLALWGAALGAALPAPFSPDLALYPEEIFAEDQTLSGEMRVETGDGTSSLPLEHTSVYAEITAGLARVTLTQWFTNPYDTPIEALYLFPLPSMAAVDAMELVCGDRVIEAFVAEKEEARQIYEEARQDGRKAALLEQVRDNLFRQSVAGLCPGEEVQVTLQYVEPVDQADGWYDWVFPMTVGPRFLPPWVSDRRDLVTPFTGDPEARKVDITVVLDEGLPLLDLVSDSHEVTVVDEGPWGAEVVPAQEEVAPDRDFHLAWTLASDDPLASLQVHRPDDQAQGYLALNVEPPLLDEDFVSRPRELIFLLDTSGSMEGEPWEAEKATVRRALKEMRPSDTFNLVRFSNEATPLFERSRPNTLAHREAAMEWLASHYDGGGTEMEEGLVTALDLPPVPGALRLVLILTDGFVGGEDTMFSLVRQHLGGSRLFSLGLGAAPNRYLLEGLAEMGRGDVIYQSPGRPVSEAVGTFYDRIAWPAMSDIQVDWGDLDVEEELPARIPDLWAGRPLRVSARYDVDPHVADEDGRLRTLVTVRGMVGSRPVVLEVPVDVPLEEPGNEAVATLWARRKIRDLTWYPRGRSEDQVKDAIVDVALEHHMVSRYTSLVAVDDDPSPCGASGATVQVPNLAPTGMAMMGTTLGAGGLGMVGRGVGGGGALTLQMIGTRGVGYGSGGGTASGLGGISGSLAAKSAASVQVVQGQPIILGAMDKSLVEAVIQRHLNGLRYCYQRELQKNPGISGKVVLKFVIAADGTVQATQVKEDTLGNQAVTRCLESRFQRMTFPSTGAGIVIVTWPMVFKDETP